MLKIPKVLVFQMSFSILNEMIPGNFGRYTWGAGYTSSAAGTIAVQNGIEFVPMLVRLHTCECTS
jgi:hypothetical protein